MTTEANTNSAAIETIWLELFARSKRSILICCAYRPPSSSVNLKTLYDQCDMALSISSHLLVCGDLNCNMLDSALPSTKEFISFCTYYHLSDLIQSGATRITHMSATQIDVILSNSPLCYSQGGLSVE